MLFLGAVWYAISFVSSIVLYPVMYKSDSSSFSKLRGAPAIGTAIAFLSAYSGLEVLRLRGRDGSEGNLLALILAFLSVGAGVISADLWRSIRGTE